MIDKNKLFNAVDRCRDDIITLGDRLFYCPELGFKEFKTAEIIKEYLDSVGIPYESEIGIT